MLDQKLDPSQESPVNTLTPSNGQIRYRSPSAAELIASVPPDPDARMKRGSRFQDSLMDRIMRHRAAILVVVVPIALVAVLLLLMPHAPAYSPIYGGERSVSARKIVPGDGSGGGSKSYVVIFDAGSSGSRVHVYCFDEHLNLLHIGAEIELFVQLKPGLSSYANDPQAAADSLVPLLEKAERTIPEGLLQMTPVRVGATAGLRSLGVKESDEILQAVKDLLKERNTFRFKPDWVSVLDGTQEGAFQWVTINYLLGNLGKKFSETVGVVDLGGGSVQMAYAISEKEALKAPSSSNGKESYVRDLFLKGKKYHLYVHSYLHFGLLAARAEILKTGDENNSYCVMGGYHGSYKYGGESYKASTSPSGSNYDKCRSNAVRALRFDESTCENMKCTFGGVWNGGGGDGHRNLFVASFFFDRAAEAGFIDPKLPVAKVKPQDFEDAAKHVCVLDVEAAKLTYTRVSEDNLPYLCMDLVYQFTLLVDGFALEPSQEITLVKQVKYGDAFVEAAWPLGSAIEAASSL